MKQYFHYDGDEGIQLGHATFADAPFSGYFTWCVKNNKWNNW